jgi:hypothetical protein
LQIAAAQHKLGGSYRPTCKERIMNELILVLFGVCLSAAGLGVTVALARFIPISLLERAQQHGRFAELATLPRASGPARPKLIGRALPAKGLHPA